MRRSAAVDRAVAARTALVDVDRRPARSQRAADRRAAGRRSSELQATIAQIGGRHGRGRRWLAARSVPGRPALAGRRGPVGRGSAARRAAGSAPPVRNGIELSLAEGQPVHAVHEGTVAFADQFSGYGNLVIVDHGDRDYSLYGHLGSLAVNKGTASTLQRRSG